MGITNNITDEIIIKEPAYASITYDKFLAVIKHELCHLYLNRIAKNNINFPRWFHEGFATLFSERIPWNKKIIVINNLHNQKLFTIHNIDNNFRGDSKKLFNLSYGYSFLLVNQIYTDFGETGLRSLLYDIMAGKSFDESFINITKIDMENYSMLFYKQIYKKYWWYKLIDIEYILFPLATLLLSIGFFIKRRKTQALLKQWELEEEMENDEKSI